MIEDLRTDVQCKSRDEVRAFVREAQATGADVMVMACLKCQIHFECALMDARLKDEIGIEMVDLATL